MLIEILIAAAAAATIAAIIYIEGKITRTKLENKLRERDLPDVFIKKIKRNKNRMKLEDMDGNEYEVAGDSISHKLHEGDMIIV